MTLSATVTLYMGSGLAVEGVYLDTERALLIRHPGAVRRAESGVHATTRPVPPWIPGSGFARPGMTDPKKSADADQLGPHDMLLLARADETLRDRKSTRLNSSH